MTAPLGEPRGARRDEGPAAAPAVVVSGLTKHYRRMAPGFRLRTLKSRERMWPSRSA